jgi:cytochrome b involved in lipid metabolism
MKNKPKKRASRSGSPTKKTQYGTIDDSLRTVSAAELSFHSTERDCWMQIEGHVYDISKYMARHPGGNAPVTYAGKDATQIFNTIHSKGILEKIGSKFIVGRAADQGKYVAAKKITRNSYYDIDKDEDGYNERGDARNGDFSREFGDHMAM